AKNSWTIQGDITSSSQHQTISTLFQPAPIFARLNVEDTVSSDAWNLLGRWERVHDNQSVSQIQVYFDHTKRDEIYLKQEHDTFDIDFQNQINLNDSHHLVYGLGYRHVSGEYRNSYAVQFMPSSIDLDLYSAFIQDEITLIPDTLNLIMGSKVEYHEFTDFEIQPSIRAVWSVAAGHNLWGAISRAVRTPSIVENSAHIVANVLPTQTVIGNNEVVSETVNTYELGYRYYGDPAFTLDLTLFYNDYDNYVSYEILSPTTIQMDNKLYGSSYGFELSTAWQMSRYWQVRASYSQLKLDMKRRGDSLDVTSVEVLNDSYAENMLKLNSSLDFGDGWELDTWIYYVSGLKNPSSVAFINGLEVDSYWSTNLRGSAVVYHPTSKYR
ncbi:MAG: TonB-dependent receptor, partial [Motiliproteus sp.]|nr:TonB-dependent receptor [Motiliproteus sp.]